MKFLKIKDYLLDSINNGTITTIAIANDKDDISIDDEIEFFNDENVSFGKATINQVSVRKYNDLKIEDISSLITSDEVELSADDHIKTVFFDYFQYKEPKSLSHNIKLDTLSVKIYADGGSRGNPGPSASGYVILTDKDELIKAEGIYVGITTNNQAEYRSIRYALESALQLGTKHARVFMDSLLVVNQINGSFKIRKPELIPIYQDIKQLVTKFESITFVHVPRELNKLADTEVNKCLDEQLGIS